MNQVWLLGITNIFPKIYTELNKVAEAHHSFIATTAFVLILVSFLSKRDFTKIVFGVALLLLAFGYLFSPDTRTFLTGLSLIFGTMLLIFWGITDYLQEKYKEEIREIMEEEQAKTARQDIESNKKIIENNVQKSKHTDNHNNDAQTNNQQPSHEQDKNKIKVSEHMKNRYGKSEE